MGTTNYKNAKEIITKNSLTEKEVEMVKLLNDQLASYFGETYSDIDCNDIAELLKWNVKTVKGVIGSLVKKNICGTYDTGTGYDVVYFVEQDTMSFYHFKVEDFTPAEEVAKVETRTSAHTVGDIHKNGLWSWTEYKPGKFDWRTIKEATPAPKVEVEKEAPVVEAPKVETHPNELTLEQFISLCKKGTKAAKGKFIKAGAPYIYTVDRKMTEQEFNDIFTIVSDNDGVYHYFNAMYSPFDIEIEEVSKDVEDVKSNSIYAKMAARTITHFKGSFKVMYKNNIITVSRLFSKDTTLSMYDINSFM